MLVKFSKNRLTRDKCSNSGLEFHFIDYYISLLLHLLDSAGSRLRTSKKCDVFVVIMRPPLKSKLCWFLFIGTVKNHNAHRIQRATELPAENDRVHGTHLPHQQSLLAAWVHRAHAGQRYRCLWVYLQDMQICFTFFFFNLTCSGVRHAVDFCPFLSLLSSVHYRTWQDWGGVIGSSGENNKTNENQQLKAN